MRKFILLFALLLFSVNAYTQPNVYGFDVVSVDVSIDSKITKYYMYTSYMSFSHEGVLTAIFNWAETGAVLDYENMEIVDDINEATYIGLKKAMLTRQAVVAFVMYKNVLEIVIRKDTEYSMVETPILQWRKK